MENVNKIRSIKSIGIYEGFLMSINGIMELDGVTVEASEVKGGMLIKAKTQDYGVHDFTKVLETESERKFVKEILDFAERVYDAHSEIIEKEEEYEQNAYDNYLEERYEMLKENA